MITRIQKSYTQRIILIVSSFLLLVSIAFIYKKKRVNERETLTSLENLETVLSPIQNLDPRTVGRHLHSQYVLELLFLPLATFDSNAQLSPILFDRLEKYETGFRIHFDPLRFGQARMMEAEDVVASYEYYAGLRQSKTSSPLKGIFHNLEQVRSEDDWIYFQLKSWDPSFPINFMNLSILPREMLDADNIDTFWGKWESGPFQLAEFKPQQHIKLIKNPYFKGRGFINISPIENVSVHLVADPSIAFNSILSGQIDLAQHTLTSLHFERIKAYVSGQYHILEYPVLSTQYIGFSFRNSALQDPKIRRFLTRHTPVSMIIQTILHKKADEAIGLFPKWLPYSFRMTPQEDREPIPSLPSNLSFTFYFSDSSQNREIVELIQNAWSKVGVRIHMRPTEPSIFVKTIEEGRADLWLGSWVGFKDPDLMNFIFHSAQIPPTGGNRGHYYHPDLDAILDKGKMSSDLTQRIAIYKEAATILQESPPYIFLWHPKGQLVLRSNLKVTEICPDGRLTYLTHIKASPDLAFNTAK